MSTMGLFLLYKEYILYIFSIEKMEKKNTLILIRKKQLKFPDQIMKEGLEYLTLTAHIEDKAGKEK